MRNEITVDGEISALIRKGGLISELTFGEIKFSEITFSVTVIFEDCIFEEEITYLKTIFNGNLVFRRCKFYNDVSLLESVSHGDISFIECNIIKTLAIASSSINNLIFEECIVDKITLSGLISQFNEGIIKLDKGGSYNTIRGDNCIVESKIEFGSIKVLDEIFFSNSTFQEQVLIDSEWFEVDRFFIEKTKFESRLDFQKGKVKSQLYISKSVFDDTVLLRDDFKITSITLTSVFSKYSFSIYFDHNIEILSISDCNFEGDFSCNKWHDKDSIEGILRVSLSGVLKGQIVFEDIHIRSFYISGSNFGVINIDKISVGLFHIVNFFNFKALTINNLSVDSYYPNFVISRSNIGKVEFLNTNLNKFEEFVIVSSNVSELILSNSSIPNSVQIRNKDTRIGYGSDINGTKSEATFYRETYRQLRLAFEKQGNQNSALHYKAKEFYYLRKEMPFGWNKVLLYINYISNNHGISWSRGILFTLSITFLFFIAYNQTLSDKYFFWTLDFSFANLCDAFSIGFDRYIDFLSSFPKIVVNEEKLTNTSSKIVVFLARIFMSYGIYQTISAFRKYGKS